MKSIRMNISLPQEIFDVLSDEVASRKRSQFITEAVKSHLKKMRIKDLPPSTERPPPKSAGSIPNWKGLSMMASIRRGDVFIVNFDPRVASEARKTRPALVVSNDVNNDHSPIVSISPIASNVTGVYSFEVKIAAGTAGFQTDSKVMINQTGVVDRVRFLKKLGNLPSPFMAKIDQALGVHYGFE